MTEAGNDWIEWNGGECPVDGRATVEVKFRRFKHELESPVSDPTMARSIVWAHTDCPGDIVAYRVVDAPGVSTESALARQPGGTHYRDATIQPVQFIEANKLGFLEGCIVKRATRHGHPTGKGAEDIRKIIHEARLILELRYGEAA